MVVLTPFRQKWHLAYFATLRFIYSRHSKLTNAQFVSAPTPLRRPPGAQSRYLIAIPGILFCLHCIAYFSDNIFENETSKTNTLYF